MTSAVVLSSYAESLYNFRGDLIRALVARGWRVYALAPDYDAAKLARVTELGAIPVSVPLDRNGMNIARDFSTLRHLYRLFREIRPQLFFGYFMKPVIYGAIAAWLVRVPRRVVMVAGLGFVFIDADYRASGKARLLRWLVSILYRMAFRLSDRVIFQNCDDMMLMLDRHMASTGRMLLVNGSGVNIDRFSLPPQPRDEAPLTFIWIGRLLKEKGVGELVDAARTLRACGHDCEVILVGGVDSNPGSLKQADVQAWHDERVVNWVGRVDDVRPYLWRSQVFVLPSYREGVPRSTQEAMASGLAVITTDAPGCRETVEEGVNGFLIPVRSAEALAAAMLRYVEDPKLAATHGRASRALAERKFDVRLINRQMLEILDPASAAAD